MRTSGIQTTMSISLSSIRLTTERRHLAQSGIGLYFVNELTHLLYVCQSVEAHELSLYCMYHWYRFSVKCVCLFVCLCPVLVLILCSASKSE